jgi:hypothetical protein
MDQATLSATRRSLHGVAELVIAGPQLRMRGSIELRVRPTGIGGAVADVVISGRELVGPSVRVPLEGTCRSLATSLGLQVSDLHDVYAAGSGVDPDEELSFDPEAVDLLLTWFGRGDAALRRFRPEETPVLWPEHFDVGISSDGVNYGASPGDEAFPDPYAYVGPWNADRLQALRESDGAFWNATFGASRPASAFPDIAAVAGFFEEARYRQP